MLVRLSPLSLKDIRTSVRQDFRLQDIRTSFIDVYGTIYLNQDFRTSGHQDFRTSGFQNIRTSGLQDFRTSGHQDIRTSGH